MGRVYAALDRESGRQVTVRRIPAGSPDLAVLVRRRQLIEALSLLNHPAFIPILDVVESQGWLWIVTPLIEGRTLSEWLKVNGRLAPHQAVGLAADLAEASSGPPEWPPPRKHQFPMHPH